MRPVLPVVIRGTGASIPADTLDNEFFCSYLDTSDEWIVARTGIRERRRVAPSESTLTLAREASVRALEDAGMAAGDIDVIICATATPETPLPATACWLQTELGTGQTAAFDIAAACSGMVYAMVLAGIMINAGAFQNALVIGAETLTRITDYEDRSTCVLFGDAGAAAVLSASPDSSRGILHYSLGADGQCAKYIWIPAGGSREPASARTVAERLHFMRMKGRELYKFAVIKMQQLVEQALAETGHKPDDLKLLIPHQSNWRIIESARVRMGLPPEKVAVNIDRYGNTSAASIGLCLDEARRAKTIGEGDLVLLVAFGAGITWASTLMRL